MDVRTFLSILIFSVLIEPNISQYYGNNYYPNMRGPMSLPMPEPLAPQPQQMAMSGPVQSQVAGPVQGPDNSDEYEDDDQPNAKYRKRTSGRQTHDSDCDYEDDGGPAPPPPGPPPPPNLVLVPYPYALVVPNLQNFNFTTGKYAKPKTREETTKISTTTKLSTTTSSTITRSTTTTRSTTRSPITTKRTTATKRPTTEDNGSIKPSSFYRLGDRRPEYIRLGDRRPEYIRLENGGPDGYRLEDRRPGGARLEDRKPEGARVDDRRPETFRLEGLRPGDINYMRPLRKTKPNWMPKYGIVPIPDNLAEKLMSQMRDKKTVQPNTRRMISRYGQYGLI